MTGAGRMRIMIGKAEIGWSPSADTREVFIETMYAKGLVATPPSRAPGGAPAAA